MKYARNGLGRLANAPYEWEYQRMKDQGEFQDVFKTPIFY